MKLPRVVLLLGGIALGVGGTCLFLARPSATPTPVTTDLALDHHNSPGNDAQRHHHVAVAQVVLSAQQRALAEIESAVPPAASARREQQSFGRVADRGELLGALHELRAAQMAASAQQALTGALHERRQQLRALVAQGEITVARELAQLDIDYRREAAADTARASRVATLTSALRARWGAALAEAAARDRALLSPLEAGRAQLIEFGATSAPVAEVYVDPAGRRARAREVQVLGPAPSVLGNAQTQTFFGLLRDAELRVGMRLSVWLAQAAEVHGVLLPSTALVWHAGAQWFFVERTPGVFERHRLRQAIAHAHGILVPGIAPDTAVVTRGAQTLLAAEFQQQIPEEDDD